MEAEFWHERWNNNEIGFHQEKVNTYLQCYWPQLSLCPGSRILVPLCGKSLDMCWLLEQGYRVLGVELHNHAVENFFSENGLAASCQQSGSFRVWRHPEIEILQGDFMALTAQQTTEIRCVYDRAAMIALPSEMRRDYCRHLQKIISPATEILLITLEYPQMEMSGPPFSVTEAEIIAAYGSSREVRCLASRDILMENQSFIEKGVTKLEEKVYHLPPDESGRERLFWRRF